MGRPLQTAGGLAPSSCLGGTKMGGYGITRTARRACPPKRKRRRMTQGTPAAVCTRQTKAGKRGLLLALGVRRKTAKSVTATSERGSGYARPSERGAGGWGPHSRQRMGQRSPRSDSRRDFCFLPNRQPTPSPLSDSACCIPLPILVPSPELGFQTQFLSSFISFSLEKSQKSFYRLK